MTRLSLFMTLSACLILLILPAFAAANSDHGRVCIYTHDKFHGHEQCYRPGEEVSDLKHFDINSVRVYGHGRAMFYEDRDFRGRLTEFTGDTADLSHVPISGTKTWRHHVGSLRIVPESKSAVYESDGFSDRGHYPYSDYPFDEPYGLRSKPTKSVDEGVCVYEKPGYEGRFQCWAPNADISDLRLANWEGKISSVRVFGHAKALVYKETEFRGEPIIIDHDVSDLSDLAMRTAGNWNREIRSIVVQPEGQ